MNFMEGHSSVPNVHLLEGMVYMEAFVFAI